MNKRIAYLLVSIFMLVISISACKKEKPSEQAETTTQEMETQMQTTVITVPMEEGIEVWGDETLASEETAETNFEDEETKATTPQETVETEPVNETTQSTEPQGTEETIQATEPEVTTPVTEETTPPETESTTGDFVWYMNLSPEEQQAYFETFDSPEAFFSWYNEAKMEYDNAQSEGKLDNPDIDLDDYVGK